MPEVTPISLLCPTRGRPTMALQFARSAAKHAQGPVEVIFYVDMDDMATFEMLRDARIDLEVRTLCGGRAWQHVNDRCVLSDTWNRLAVVAEGEILGHMGDDIVFRTPGWDRMVSEAFERVPDRICFVYGNDLIQGERLGTHGFLHRRWVQTLGYFVPPYFSHDYNDTWLTEVATAIGRRVYLPGMVTEHLHPDVGKRPYDQTYLEHAQRGREDDVAALYESLVEKRAADVDKLVRVMS